ncbi:MAG: M23 family metallopeptidase [Desulfonauticus sp.]|nr:M23 family metallopeptidase [Desulfonauticus sp.]
MAAKKQLFCNLIFLTLFWPIFAEAKVVVDCPREVFQGDAFWVTFYYSPDVSSLLINYRQKRIKIPLFSQGVTKIILGAKVNEKNNQVIRYFYREKGKFNSGKVRIFIQSKRFRVQRLRLPKKMVYFDLPTLRRIRREKKVLKQVLSRISPHLFLNKICRPVFGKVLSPFGVKRVLNGEPRSYHRGVDFRAPLNTPIKAFSRGKVVFRKEMFFGGKTVVLDHGLGIYSLYMHLNKFKVRLNEYVDAGETVGLAGKTGRATGPHLHFALFVLGTPVNPLSLFLSK